MMVLGTVMVVIKVTVMMMHSVPSLLLFTCQVMSYSFETPVDYSLPGFSVHGISQAKILEWVAISFSRGSSWKREQTHVSCIRRWILYH